MRKPTPLVEIAGTGRFIPDNVVTNEDLAKTLATSDEWIRSRTGIRERRIAPDDMGAADLGTGAEGGKAKRVEIAKMMQADGPRLLADSLVAELRDQGFSDVRLASEGDAPDGAVVIQGRFTILDPGSKAKRYWAGFGARRRLNGKN